MNGYKEMDYVKTVQLFIAVENGVLPLIRTYVEDHHVDIDVVRNNETPLMVAVRKNNLEVVKYLVQQGANINKGYHYNGNLYTPFTQCKDFTICEYFLQHGATVVVSRRTVPMLLSLLDCIQRNCEKQVDIFSEILTYYRYVRMDHYLYTLILYGARFNKNVIRYLLKKHLDDCTDLISKSKDGKQVVRECIKNKLDCHLREKIRWSKLTFREFLYSNLDMVKLFIQPNDTILTKTLCKLIKRGRNSTVIFFIQRGMNMYFGNRYIKPLKIAKKRKNVELIDFFHKEEQRILSLYVKTMDMFLEKTIGMHRWERNLYKIICDYCIKTNEIKNPLQTTVN